MRKACLAGVLALAFAPQPVGAEQIYPHPHVKQVICTYSNGDTSRGTAWRLSRGRFASVSHVTGRGGACVIDGKPIWIEHDDPFGDFSIVRSNDEVGGGIKVNCGGFAHGNHYYSTGYARGNPWSVSITLRANMLFLNAYGQWQIFTGIEHVIPGMSGGPILNQDGEAVGSVNAYNKEAGLSWSRDLKRTALCPS